MLDPSLRPTWWLEFQLLSDGLRADAVQTMPLAQWHDVHTPVFYRFSALPAELRLKVWEYLIAPRIVGIACLCKDDNYVPPVEDQRRQLWGQHSVVKSPIPVLLHVNQETRALALKHYELSFEWKIPPGLTNTEILPPLAPDRSPILSAPESTSHPPTQNPQTTNSLPGSSSTPHMSSYHDLLDPSPSSSSSNNSTDRPETTTTTTTTTTRDQIPRTSTKFTSTYVAGRTSSPPRTWFNFDLDVVYLLGELEPCDIFGVNNPMAYFIPAQTTRRVRKTAVSFGALRYGETGGQQIFGALFHVIDRFVRASASSDGDDEVFICVTERDEWTHAMMGHDTGLVDERYRYRHGYGHTNTNSNNGNNAPLPTANRDVNDGEGNGDGNVVQNIWRSWYRGSIVTSPLANLRFSLIPQNDLEHYVHEFMDAKPARRKKKREFIEEGKGGGVE